MLRIRDLVRLDGCDNIYVVTKYLIKIHDGSVFVDNYDYVLIKPLFDEIYPGEISVSVTTVINYMVVKNVKKHKLI